MRISPPPSPGRKLLQVACLLAALFMGIAPAIAGARTGECGPLSCCGHCGLKGPASTPMVSMADAGCCRGSEQTSCNSTSNNGPEESNQLAAIGFRSQFKPVFSALFPGIPLPEKRAAIVRSSTILPSVVFASLPLYLRHGTLRF
jgi:hypothetical protein